jgi:hypothetical protein
MGRGSSPDVSGLLQILAIGALASGDPAASTSGDQEFADGQRVVRLLDEFFPLLLESAHSRG